MNTFPAIGITESRRDRPSDRLCGNVSKCLMTSPEVEGAYQAGDSDRPGCRKSFGRVAEWRRLRRKEDASRSQLEHSLDGLQGSKGGRCDEFFRAGLIPAAPANWGVLPGAPVLGACKTRNTVAESVTAGANPALPTNRPDVGLKSCLERHSESRVSVGPGQTSLDSALRTGWPPYSLAVGAACAAPAVTKGTMNEQISHEALARIQSEAKTWAARQIAQRKGALTEQRRYEVASRVLAALLYNEGWEDTAMARRTQVGRAIDYADLLLARLASHVPEAQIEAALKPAPQGEPATTNL